MGKIKQFIAKQNDVGVRMSRFVISVTQNLPTSVLYKSFRNKRIKVNKKFVLADYRICENDVIELYLNDEFFVDCTSANALKFSNTTNNTLNIENIVFEDNNILIINKQSGLLCHSDNTGDENLVDMVCTYLSNKGEYIKSSENRFSPALCNRIDRGTSGLVIAAKNYFALRDMNSIISNNLLTKQYLCITKGTPQSGIYCAFLKRDINSKKVSISLTQKENYKQIKTGITVLQQKNNCALCKITLFTGRTHQIRAHLAFLGYPLLGDTKYGDSTFNKTYNKNVQSLCAYKITFANIPVENTLSYLSGKKVKLQNPDIKNEFLALK